MIIAQQQRVRARFPAHRVGELKLLPTDRRNPDGRRAITAFSLVVRAPGLGRPRCRCCAPPTAPSSTRPRIVLYAYRHSYAQRHADAGVPIDVLRELMDPPQARHHQAATTASARPAAARPSTGSPPCSSTGTATGSGAQAQALLDSEHARRAVGEVAVPFGVCAEPSNVKAGGSACPYRFRCAGCDHFRTDVSYLPDLQAYLDDLLRNRERVLASHRPRRLGTRRGHPLRARRSAGSAG